MNNNLTPDQQEKVDKVNRDWGAALLVLCIARFWSNGEDEEAPTRIYLKHHPLMGPNDRKNKTRLFPGRSDSPLGTNRGDSSSYDLEECLTWLMREYPDIAEKIAEGDKEESNA